MTFVEILKSFFFCLVQRVSEFLPISSSGHLVLFGAFFSPLSFYLLFILITHLGSLMAVFSVYYSDILFILKQFIKKPFPVSSQNRLVYLIFLASLPSLPAAFLLLPWIEKSFTQIHWIGYGFLLTGTVLFFTKWPLNKKNKFFKSQNLVFAKKTLSNEHKEQKQDQNTTYTLEFDIYDFSFFKAFIIGLSQVFAFFPGMSRPGWTISTALFLGVPKKQAVSFSFLMAIPAICGALAFHIFQYKQELLLEGSSSFFYLVIAFLNAWLFGYFALKWVIRSLQNLSFPIFAFYLWPLGLIIIMKDLL